MARDPRLHILVLVLVILAGCSGASPGGSAGPATIAPVPTEQTPTRFAPLEAAMLRPGDRISPVGLTSFLPESGGSCTLNALFRDGTEVLAATAAHCLDRSPGETVGIYGTSERPLGNATIVYSSFFAMNTTADDFVAACYAHQGRLPDAPDCWNDLVLLRLPPEVVVQANPAVRVVGGATGVGEVIPGDAVVAFGRAPQRPLRTLAGDPADVRAGIVLEVGTWYVLAEFTQPSLGGDSGGPALTADGMLFGMTNWMFTGKVTQGGEPPSVGMMRMDTALQWMEMHGGPRVEVVPAPWPLP